MAARRLTYTTDLTDEEWRILEPLLPPDKAGGRPRKYPLRSERSAQFCKLRWRWPVVGLGPRLPGGCGPGG
jgi:hypothetical protein